jgi:hypothetical protein
MSHRNSTTTSNIQKTTTNFHALIEPYAAQLEHRPDSVIAPPRKKTHKTHQDLKEINSGVVDREFREGSKTRFLYLLSS